MHPCESCSAAGLCPAYNTRWAEQCEAFTGPTVVPVIPTEFEQDFQAWLEDRYPAAPDYDERREAYYQAGMYPPKTLMKGE